MIVSSRVAKRHVREMRLIAVALLVALLTGCAASAHERRMRDSGDDDVETLKKVGIGLALVAVGAAVYYGAKKGGAGGQLAQVSDYDWDWDQFYQQGSLVWACRGIQTGQFADQSKCAYKAQTDFRWPGK
jgi:hypothetical protein